MRSIYDNEVPVSYVVCNTRAQVAHIEYLELEPQDLVACGGNAVTSESKCNLMCIRQDLCMQRTAALSSEPFNYMNVRCTT